MLKTDEVVFLLVDVQGKLARLMHEKERLFRNLQTLIKGIRVLAVPILWMEQNPAGIGPTIPEVADLLSDIEPIDKMSFSCCRNDRFLEALSASGRKQVLIAGIETMWTPAFFGGSKKRARKFLNQALALTREWQESDPLVVTWATTPEILAHLAQLEILCGAPDRARQVERNVDVENTVAEALPHPGRARGRESGEVKRPVRPGVGYGADQRFGRVHLAQGSGVDPDAARAPRRREKSEAFAPALQVGGLLQAAQRQVSQRGRGREVKQQGVQRAH